MWDDHRSHFSARAPGICLLLRSQQPSRRRMCNRGTHVRYYRTEMGDVWDQLRLPQKRRLALDIINLYDQISRLRAAGCGGIYHSFNSLDDCELLAKHRRSPRWAPVSPESLRVLRSHCDCPIGNGYQLGPLNDISLLKYRFTIPSPSQTMPTFTSDEYIKLLTFNGNPTARSDCDLPARDKCVQLFQSTRNLYPNSPVFAPSTDLSHFRFSHGDLHEGNILVNPQSGEITAVLDWEAAAFRPLWTELCGVG